MKKRFTMTSLRTQTGHGWEWMIIGTYLLLVIWLAVLFAGEHEKVTAPHKPPGSSKPLLSPFRRPSRLLGPFSSNLDTSEVSVWLQSNREITSPIHCTIIGMWLCRWKFDMYVQTSIPMVRQHLKRIAAWDDKHSMPVTPLSIAGPVTVLSSRDSANWDKITILLVQCMLCKDCPLRLAL